MLFACNRISALVWNRCIDLASEYRKNNDGAWISLGQLQAITKKTVPIHSQSIQSIVESYCEARDATRMARSQGLDTRYPWRHKHMYPTTWKQSAIRINYEKYTLTLSLGQWQKIRQDPIVVTLPKNTIEKLQSCSVKEISLVWNRRLQFSICCDNGQTNPELLHNNNEAAIDLGVVHSITAFCRNGEAIIVTGRLLRSINRYRAKKLSELHKLMNCCTKYSRRWKKLQYAKRRLSSKLDAQVRDLTHKITRSFVHWAVANNVDKVFIGDVEGVERNTRNGAKRKRKKRVVSQQLSTWNFGQQLEYLKYKLRAEGIQLIKISEAYSSQTCPICGHKHKARGRNYRCSCGYSAHRDIHGARNILSLGLYERFEYVANIKHITYLRTA